MITTPQNRKQLEKHISLLLGKPMPVKYAGPSGVGNTWQEAVGVPINNKPEPDYHGIEVKSLVIEEGNIKGGSSLSLKSKTPDWEKLAARGITKSAFLHRIDYAYRQIDKALFFTKRLRYVVSPATRTIDWLVVSDELLPTEPYSRAPARSGELVDTWRVEDALSVKVENLSLTLLKLDGKYPNGTITPMRSFMIEALPDKYLNLLADGSIRYEVRRDVKTGHRPIWDKVAEDAAQKFNGFPEFENLVGPDRDQMLRTAYQWADDEFEKRKGQWHDHGTGFRLERSVLNTMLSLQGEVLPAKSNNKT